MQNMIRRGQTLTWRNSTSALVKGGDLVIVGDVVGVAAVDITAGATGALKMEGVFRLPKDGAAIAVGARVYVDSGGDVTATAGSNPAGVAWAEAGAAEPFALVKINV